VEGKRYLLVTADDFGIGPATSQGILDLAAEGLVTGSVLLVNSPHSEQAVGKWRRAGRPVELGWHPCLTLDRPILPPSRVPSLVAADGRFHSLRGLVSRLSLGRIRAVEIEAELRAQWIHFHDLVGHVPRLVNSHHHVQVFPPLGGILRQVLSKHQPLPFLRRVREPWGMLARVPGARGKRTLLSALGRREARHQAQAGFPGNDWLAGITNPSCVHDPEFLTRWLTQIPGQVIELTCHPGHLDQTLLGRDCTAHDGQLQRRVGELRLLRHAGFREACLQAGFTLISATDLTTLRATEQTHAA
jgi:predicted glycoside hydrolase/deacetylase ChbG (UPF0249 family)